MKKNEHAQEMAKQRHLSLTPERRKEIASLAAKKRWENKALSLSTEKLEKD